MNMQLAINDELDTLNADTFYNVNVVGWLL